MYCPSDVNTGFIEIVGPIQPLTLNNITLDSYPLSISFAPRTTPPSIVAGNKIDESTDNTCTYRGNKYTLTPSVQICSPTNKGYYLTGSIHTPVAELIIPFVRNKTGDSALSGILLCVPIYERAYAEHDAYIQQLLNSDNPAASLQTIFYNSDNDVSQTSFAYKTCFETLDADNNPSSKSLYVVVFPHGIHLLSKDYQSLLQLIGNELQQFQMPPAITGGESTLQAYKLNEDGIKIPTTISESGNIYTTQVSSSSEEFTNRFEYFLKPPRLPTNFSKDMCPYYKTTEYKCVPFNQLKDLQGKYVIPGSKTLDTILHEKESVQQSQGAMNVDTPSSTLTTEQIEETISGIIGGVIVTAAVIWIGSRIAKSS